MNNSNPFIRKIVYIACIGALLIPLSLVSRPETRTAEGEINDAGNSVKKILTPVQNVCTNEEKKTLLKMFETISAIEGTPSDMQLRLIDEAKRILLSE